MNTILVIADDKDNWTALLERLNLEDYIGLEAANSLIGLQIIQEHLPNLIVCDMPIMTGLAALRAAKIDPIAAKIPFLILMGQNDAEAGQASQNLETEYLTKPVGIAAFLAHISQFLNPKVPSPIIEIRAECV